MTDKKYSRTKNSALNLATGITEQIIVTLLKFITRTVFINILGKEYLGIGGLFSNILSMLSLTELGLDTAINFRLYKPIAEKDNHRIRLLMKFYRQAYTVIGIVIFCLGIFLIPFLHYLIKDYDNLAVLKINATGVFLLYLLQSVTSYLFFAYRTALLKAAQKTYIITIVTCLIEIITNITQIIILIVFKNFVLYISTIIFYNILKNLICSIISVRFFPEAFCKEEKNLSKEELRELFKDCGATFIYKMNLFVLKSTDNIILSSFIGLAIVGTYSNYLMFYNTIRTFLSKFYASVKASLGDLFVNSDIEKTYFMFKITNFVTIVLYGTGCIGVAVVGDELISAWLGKSYVIPQPFSILIGIEILLLGIRTNLSQIRNITGLFKQGWFRPVLGMIINLVVSIVLVQLIGIYGVILGTIISNILTNFLVDPFIIYKYVFNNKSVYEYYKMNMVYILLLALIYLLDFFACKYVLISNEWISVIIHSLICGISVPVIFLIVFYNSKEVKYLLNKMNSVVLKIVGKKNG